MGAFFHIISTGGGAGASRASRYIAERDKDLKREGPGTRPLFSEDREGLSYRKADRILDLDEGRPEKNDLIHFSVSFEEEDFHQLGSDEKERKERFREVIREGMKGMAEELNVEQLTWIAGIHRNSDHPHAHVVIRKDVVERSTGREKRIGRIRKDLLAHKEIQEGKEVVVHGRIADRFQAALVEQQALHLAPDKQRQEAQEFWKQLVERMRQEREGKAERPLASDVAERTRGVVERGPPGPQPERSAPSTHQPDQRRIAASWNSDASPADDHLRDYRIVLGKRLELSIRLAFAQVWYDRAVDHGETLRFNVVDQSAGEERRISELDVERRSAARASRLSSVDRAARDKAIELDLARHIETLQELAEAREAKIAALTKDLGSLSAQARNANRRAVSVGHTHDAADPIPLMDRQTLSGLQEQAVKLNLPAQASELEQLRGALGREFKAPSRTDCEAAQLAAQLNVARADFLTRDKRLENFDASLHLTPYEVHGERWSLAALDKEINRRREDSKLVPARAARLDLRSLSRLNYSATAREEAAEDVQHLTFVRGEVVRQIEDRRDPLVEDRNLAREMADLLEHAYASERQARVRGGKTIPEPRYEHYQIKSLESSAETLRDSQLLREVDAWEKGATKNDPDINWEGRAVAREITSGLAVEETKERLQHFLESKKVASLHLGDHRTSTLREVEARTLTEYLANVIMDTREQRDHRHSVKLAAREQHGRLVNDLEKARDYHEAARELAAEAKDREPEFTDKEKINLEIYGERQNDPAERERYLEMSRGEGRGSERDVAASRSR